jgi:NAD-dependent deacetylase
MATTITDPAEAAAELKTRIKRARKVVFFGGAGVSTASGIPDFRSEDGLYHQKFRYPPEEMLSHSFYVNHPDEFFEFYRTRMIALGAKPNKAHFKLAELEREGKLSAVVTQNIDGLHQMAGSHIVYELHGSVHRNICQNCEKSYSAEWIMSTSGIPHCEVCGGSIKPDVVLYEEPLNEDVLFGAAAAIGHADMLIIGGTSLVVYPAAGLVQYFQGNDLVIVNKQPTPQDSSADLVCACDIAKAFDF